MKAIKWLAYCMPHQGRSTHTEVRIVHVYCRFQATSVVESEINTDNSNYWTCTMQKNAISINELSSLHFKAYLTHPGPDCLHLFFTHLHHPHLSENAASIRSIQNECQISLVWYRRFLETTQLFQSAVRGGCCHWHDLNVVNRRFIAHRILPSNILQAGICTVCMSGYVCMHMYAEHACIHVHVRE